MELKVQNYDLPSVIQFNYDELKTALTEKCHEYEVMVYTDEQIKAAKSDRANLNRLKKALNDERLRREREYMEPFNEFKTKINEIISIIDKPASMIDARVKEFEQKKKDEKKAQIAELFAEFNFPEYITLEKVWDESWLNSSVSLARVKECLKDVSYRNEQAVQTINDLPEGAFEAMEYYKRSLDVVSALAKANDIVRINRAKKAAEEEARKQEDAKPEVKEEIPFDGMPEPIDVPEVEPAEDDKRFWISFRACLSVNEARELNAFFRMHGIPFEAEGK